MAKEVEGLHPDMRFNEAAVLVIQAKLDELFVHEAGTRAGEDIEYLHDMRVASRRMRAAMDVFEECFPRQVYTPLRKTAATLTRSLGEVRDRDVMLEFLERYMKALPAEERIGIEDLASTVRDEQAAYRRAMIQILDEVSRIDFRRRLAILLKGGQS